MGWAPSGGKPRSADIGEQQRDRDDSQRAHSDEKRGGEIGDQYAHCGENIPHPHAHAAQKIENGFEALDREHCRPQERSENQAHDSDGEANPEPLARDMVDIDFVADGRPEQG